MDNSLCIWDMRPQISGNHRVKTFTGHIHSDEKNLPKCDWSPNGLQVIAGSGDHLVYIWDVTSRQLLHKLEGHNGTVLEAVFHPTEAIIGSCSVDRSIYL